VRDDIYVELSEVRFMDRNFRSNVDLEYNIMQCVPGTQIGSKAAKFGDFNGDGIDEIFTLVPYDESHCFIWKYDNETGKVVFPYTCGYRLSSAREPAPFGFYTHLGVSGIITHYWDYMKERYAWLFFAWDIVFQKYTVMAEMEENEVDYSMFYRSDEPLVWENRQNTNETAAVEAAPVVIKIEPPVEAAVVITEQPEEMVLSVVEDSGKGGKFVFVIIIIGGVVTVAAAAILLVARKKRKSGFLPK
jgi:hypothetical protein